MAAESYLEKQAKRRKQEYLEAEVCSPRLAVFEMGSLALRDAPDACRKRLNSIMLRNKGTAEQEERPQLGKAVFSAMNRHGYTFDSGGCSSGRCTATVIGSSQQGKTSMLNSLLTLFGFHFQCGLSFPEEDLLPTHSKDRIGLPFPLRLEYGPCYELHLKHWQTEELEEFMCIAAEKALASNPEYFEDVKSGFELVKEKSFMEFVTHHGAIDEEQNYRPQPSAGKAVDADGETEIYDFKCDAPVNPSIQAHKAVHKFLVHLVEEGLWFHYKHVTLKCPSQMLKHLNNGEDEEDVTSVLDLPGVGIVDDDNYLVEELVFRDVRDANTIIVLTGERSFTQDVLLILKRSVFERLLDPHITPPPTVAITNSKSLRGLRKEEMDSWQTATLEGDLGWNREIEIFVQNNFTERRARDRTSIQPDLFPNDLSGFMESGMVLTEAADKGVSRLVGYFLRLPQECLIAQITEVRGKAMSVMQILNQLREANMLSWKGLRASRLAKEVKKLRSEQYQRDLDSKLNLVAQKKMFGFESEFEGGQEMLQIQLNYVDELFMQQKRKLFNKLEKVKNGSRIEKYEWTKLIKNALIQIASEWDDKVGCQAFDRFLNQSQELSNSLFEKWAKEAFLMNARDYLDHSKKESACKFLIEYLKETARMHISSKEKKFQYTWTHGFRQQSWNLDFDVLSILGIRKGRSSSFGYNQIWLSIEELMKAKERLFKDLIIELISLRSPSINQLVSRLKMEITSIFEGSLKNFCAVINALENIAQGKVTASVDPIVALFDELKKLTTQLDRYIETHKKTRDAFGGQELQSLLEKRSYISNT